MLTLPLPTPFSMTSTSTLRAALAIVFFAFGISTQAQSGLPSEVRLTDNGRLARGSEPVTGLYDLRQVHKLEITLAEPDWFALLDGGTGPGAVAGVELIGKLTFNHTLLLDSVVVGIKGETSDLRNTTQKKSFNLKLDRFVNQDLLGYDNLNLNCSFEDASGMREVLYYATARGFTHALKGAFVDLYINGAYWGPYSNVQQIEGSYIKEWFGSNDGAWWRAESPNRVGGGGGGGGGTGGNFGTGVSSLNYIGADSTDYAAAYSLRHNELEDPWQPLIEVCKALNRVPIDSLHLGLQGKLDIDRTLWTLVQEMLFADDDSYINKGGADYYVYLDAATGLLMPLEVDGNSVLSSRNVTWDPFYHETDARYPLLNRLLKNPEIRQRYLAHLRTALAQHFVPATVGAQIDSLAALLRPRVPTDPKALFTLTQFNTGVGQLKTAVQTRANTLLANAEVNRIGLSLSDLTVRREQNTSFVRVAVEGDASKVYLYHGQGFDGSFERVLMLDDGLHGDGAAADGSFGASLPAYGPGAYVRYYVEGIEDDAFATASYLPEGAEHSVAIYQMPFTGQSAVGVVINELMADNVSVVADLSGAFEDWVELYNTGATSVDLSGHFLSDDAARPDKYVFPAGTVVAANGYLIVWLDEDSADATPQELHANFRLSKSGESITLYSPSRVSMDNVTFGPQNTDKSFGRSPNGTGSFRELAPTFRASNGGSSAVGDVLNRELALSISPNPTSSIVNLRCTEPLSFVELRDMHGRLLQYHTESLQQLDLGGLPAGIYTIVYGVDGQQAFAKTRYTVRAQRVVKQ